MRFFKRGIWLPSLVILLGVSCSGCAGSQQIRRLLSGQVSRTVQTSVEPTPTSVSIPSKTPKSIQRTSSLQVNIGGAEMLLIDSQGRRTGYDPQTGQAVQDIPDSAYYDSELVPPGAAQDDVLSREIFISQNANGPYRILVLSGPTNVSSSEATAVRFGFSVIRHDEHLNQSRAEKSGQISKGENLEYQLRFNPDDGEISIEPSL